MKFRTLTLIFTFIFCSEVKDNEASLHVLQAHRETMYVEFNKWVEQIMQGQNEATVFRMKNLLEGKSFLFFEQVLNVLEGKDTDPDTKVQADFVLELCEADENPEKFVFLEIMYGVSILTESRTGINFILKKRFNPSRLNSDLSFIDKLNTNIVFLDFLSERKALLQWFCLYIKEDKTVGFDCYRDHRIGESDYLKFLWENSCFSLMASKGFPLRQLPLVQWSLLNKKRRKTRSIYMVYASSSCFLYWPIVEALLSLPNQEFSEFEICDKDSAFYNRRVCLYMKLAHRYVNLNRFMTAELIRTTNLPVAINDLIQTYSFGETYAQSIISEDFFDLNRYVNPTEHNLKDSHCDCNLHARNRFSDKTFLIKIVRFLMLYEPVELRLTNADSRFLVKFTRCRDLRRYGRSKKVSLHFPSEE